MLIAAVIFAVFACVAIMGLGTGFLVAPRASIVNFGVAPDRLRALTEIKGARDITSGIVPLVVWAAAGRTALGWVFLAAAVTPIADAAIVISNGGRISQALTVHGLTALLMVAAGLILVLS
jgi:hypothetical protein